MSFNVEVILFLPLSQKRTKCFVDHQGYFCVLTAIICASFGLGFSAYVVLSSSHTNRACDAATLGHPRRKIGSCSPSHTICFHSCDDHDVFSLTENRFLHPCAGGIKCTNMLYDDPTFINSLNQVVRFRLKVKSLVVQTLYIEKMYNLRLLEVILCHLLHSPIFLSYFLNHEN